MEIRIAEHTLARAIERGANESDIRTVLTAGVDIPAKNDRLGKAMVFPFNQVRNGKHYLQRRVEVIYVIENDVIITVTVYVFYGQWEAEA